MINAATLAEKVTGLDLVGPFAIRMPDFYGFGGAGDMVAALAMGGDDRGRDRGCREQHISPSSSRSAHRAGLPLGSAPNARMPVIARRWALALRQHEAGRTLMRRGRPTVEHLVQP
ncbi:MAG: hypothetical protein H6893_11755 [Brucellaceae bacterium]|nr:hypothetical protein [Brucellaceae bacterium]